MAWDAAVSKLASIEHPEYLFFVGGCYLALAFASRRRWIPAAASLALAVAWLSLYLPVTVYVQSLSPDSFVEAHRFDWNEARFWLLTLREALHPDLSYRKLAAYLALGLVSYAALQLALRRLARLSPRTVSACTLVLAGSFMGTAVYQTSAFAVAAYLDNGEGFEIAARNFGQPVPAVAAARRPLEVIAYVGESTSVMNMGVYGYPRDTTPELARLLRQDAGLLLFRHVFATHAHTSRSLLEALSFGVDPREDVLPIAKRRRIPLPGVLAGAGVETRLISNQGQRGAWEQASSIVFRDTPSTFRLAQELEAAGQGRPGPSRWDDEFFLSELPRQGPPAGRARVTFLHAYAGHGPYLQNIPPRFRQLVDPMLARLPKRGILDDPGRSVDMVEAYDAAMRYVDHSVARVIQHVRRQPHPAVLVYFADHGDAAFSGRGHDSARFRHEMLRIPFVLYFNQAARREHADLFSRYQVLARRGATATLAQLPSTLLDLLGIERPEGLVATPVIGEDTPLPPVLVREQAGALSFLNLNPKPLAVRAPTGQALVERDDEDTRLFLATRSGRPEALATCSRRPRSFEDLSRRIMLAGCQPPPTGLVEASLLGRSH